MSKQILLLTFLCLGLSSASIASDLKPGDVFPATKLEDQHGELVTISSAARIVIFAVERPASDLVNSYLEKKPSDFLDRHQAHFVVDISGMPKMITRMFALPKMRKRPYAVLLAEEAETLGFIPRRHDEVTVIRLNEGLVESVNYATTGADLDEVF